MTQHLWLKITARNATSETERKTTTFAGFCIVSPPSYWRPVVEVVDFPKGINPSKKSSPAPLEAVPSNQLQLLDL